MLSISSLPIEVTAKDEICSKEFEILGLQMFCQEYSKLKFHKLVDKIS